jgi:hypothetical protein
LLKQSSIRLGIAKEEQSVLSSCRLVSRNKTGDKLGNECQEWKGSRDRNANF